MEFELPPLPFEEDALEPYISARTIDFHYNKHHRGYLNKLDDALEKGDARREMGLEDIITNSEGHIFNCAAQVWNHSFYWNSLDPSGNTAMSEELCSKVNDAFGGVESLKEALHTAGAGQFGSGWAWLGLDTEKNRLTITSTSDAETLLSTTITPLLTLDVWEHAYYLDYQNDRGAHLTSLIDNALNWEFANANFAQIAKA